MDSAPLQGLSDEEAARRLVSGGANEIAGRKGRSFLQIIAETMREPMFLLLIGAAALYLVLGDFGEGAFLVGGAFAAIGLVVFQEARSERALAALRELAQPHARVIRDGNERQIPARELVPGDLLLVAEGERLPADGLLVGGEVLSLDESTLTGESAPVSRQPAPDGGQAPAEPLPGPDAGSFVFAGTVVVRGQGVVRIVHTGDRSALGRIGRALAEIEYEPTPLQRRAGRLVGLLGLVALAFCGLVAVAYGLLRDDWIGGALAGVTVAISLIPEEFPMVLAVFLALGAWRLATQKVLARRSAVIETLGGATVLCVDKTGTLTENHMRVARLWSGGRDISLRDGGGVDAQGQELLRLASLASSVRPTDPMDRALRALCRETLPATSQSRGEPERSWPLRPQRLAVVQLWGMPDGAWIAAAKGAPEAIFGLCGLDDAEADKLHAVIESYAEQGLRVLGVASARLEDACADEPEDMPFRFAGLVGFIDPLRADATAALGQARAAGIKVLMITGDHPATARAIARAAGIDTDAGVMTGPELAALDFDQLREKLRTVRVFARITPEQKLRLVQALKAEDEVVAMTGDGVNDAPALEAAHIGVAMGRRGTDVAREASDLVLLDDRFASLVDAIRLGRRIFSNLRRALIYITAIHVPIAGLALAPILLGLPPMLFPMHVMLLELVIDPTCSLVFEAGPGQRGAMQRPPRRQGEALFGAAHISQALMQGSGILAGVLGLYVWALNSAPGMDLAARGAAFVALVVGNLALALADSASPGPLFARHRRVYWIIAGMVAVVLAVVLTVPPATRLFALSRPDLPLLMLALTVGLASGGWPGVVTILRHRTNGRPSPGKPQAG